MNPQRFRETAYLQFVCLRAESDAAGARYMRTGHSYLACAWLAAQVMRAWNIYLLSVNVESTSRGGLPNPAKETYEID